MIKKTLILYFILFIIGCSLINLTSAWSTNTFNNSLTSESLMITEPIISTHNIFATIAYNFSGNTSDASSANDADTGNWAKLYNNSALGLNYTVPSNTFNYSLTYAWRLNLCTGTASFRENLSCYYSGGYKQQYSSIVTTTCTGVQAPQFTYQRNISDLCYNGGNMSLKYDITGTDQQLEKVDIFTSNLFYRETKYQATRYLAVPQNTYVTNAFMNLTGFPVYNVNNDTWISAEPASSNSNLSMELRALRTGIINAYSISCPASAVNVYFNLSDYSTTIKEGIFNITAYSLTSTTAQVNISQNNVVLANKIVTACAGTLKRDTFVRAYTGTLFNFSGQYPPHTGNISFTEALYPNNLSITNTRNSLIIYNDTGSFNKSDIRTSNFASIINSYLPSCTYSNGWCLVPLTFNSDSMGILSYSDMLYNNDGYTLSSINYSEQTFETARETFTVNITYDSVAYFNSRADLVYDGISYTATRIGSGSTYAFNVALDIPLSVSTTENRSFYWNISLINSTGTTTYQSNIYSQIVNMTYLYICNATYDVPYVNFTFKDENSLGVINASLDDSLFYYYLGGGSVLKSYSFLNTTNNPSYAFCYDPRYKSVNTAISYFRYSNTNYPQRNYYVNTTYTNTTTLNTLYLLSSTSGIYTSIQVLQSLGTTLSGATVIAERQFSGVWVTVGTGVTDAAGIVTFWVNPNYPLRLTATKSGFPTTQVTITPSQSQYSLYMGSTSTNVTYDLSTKGMLWRIFPSSGRIDGLTTFGMNLTASYDNLQFCKLNLVRADDGIILSTTTVSGSSECNISITYNIPAGVRVFGQFYIWTDTSGDYFLIDGDALWYRFSTNNTSPWTTITNMFHNLNNIPEFGTDELRQEFSKIILFYFALIVLVGLLCYFTEYDRLYPGFFVVIVWVFIAIASKGGFLTLNFGSSISGEDLALSETIKQYTVMMISGLFTAGYLLNRWARDL